MNDKDLDCNATPADPQKQSDVCRCEPAPTVQPTKVTYSQDQEWKVTPIKCMSVANEKKGAAHVNVLALTADQPKLK